MLLPKKQWLLMQIIALLVITGGVFLVKPYLARAISVTPHVAPGNMTGQGRSGMPYEVYTCQNLSDMRYDLRVQYRLMNDIDCSDTVNWNNGSGFSPIGQAGNAFRGGLDGYGHTISGLYISQATANDNLGYTALFAQTGNYTVLNCP